MKRLCVIRSPTERRPPEMYALQYLPNCGGLRALTTHEDPEIAKVAAELQEIVDENPSKLMNDEQEGLDDFGIKTTAYFEYVTYYEGTGRLSVLYHCRTNTKEDTMKVAVECPPEDIVKKEKVDKWVESEPELERKVRDDFRKNGINF